MICNIIEINTCRLNKNNLNIKKKIRRTSREIQNMGRLDLRLELKQVDKANEDYDILDQYLISQYSENNLHIFQEHLVFDSTVVPVVLRQNEMLLLHQTNV